MLIPADQYFKGTLITSDRPFYQNSICRLIALPDALFPLVVV